MASPLTRATASVTLSCKIGSGPVGVQKNRAYSLIEDAVHMSRRDRPCVFRLRKLRRRQRRQWDALYVSQRPWPALTFRNVAYGSVETCCGVTESNCDVIVTVYWSCVAQGFEWRLFGWPTVVSEIA